jgi:spermidine/putrescine transport system substrate-binding protein
MKFYISVGVALCFLATLGSGCTKKNVKTVNLAIWSGYLDPAVISNFETDTGVRVRISNYSSNEELLAKIQAGASDYDVIVPSDYMVLIMSKLNLLEKLDSTLVPDIKKFDSRFVGRNYDSKNEYSFPYDWGTTGFAVNHDLTSEKITSWKDVFSNPKIAGKLTFLDDSREVTAAALKSMGLSLNSRKAEDLNRAKELLIKIRPRVKSFNSETKMPLINGEVAVAHAYMMDVLQAKRESGRNIEYIIPSDGCTQWTDNLAIPRSAPHKGEAYQLLAHLLTPQSSAATVKKILVAPVLSEVPNFLSKELVGDKALFPSHDLLKNCEWMDDLGEAHTLWDRIWTEVKAAS